MAAAKASLPEFRATSLDEIASTTTRLRASFHAGKTKPLEYRLIQLRKLYWAIRDNTPLIQAALAADIGKVPHEALMSEIYFVLEDLMKTIKSLAKWAADEPVEDVPLHFRLLSFRTRKEPLGAGLVIGTYNFPFSLCVHPVVGAIAAGCTCVLKPSENAPATAMVMKQLFDQSLDPDCYAVVNGAIPEATALLDRRWDKICYTGNQAVAKIILAKAAENLTPVTLELGGLNPAFVTRHADVKLAARRLLWGKSLNAGQVCLSQNYMLVERSVLPAFVDALKAAHATFFPNGPKASPDLGRIVNQRQFQRMKKMLDETGGKIVLGGEMDEKELYLSPTVVQVESIDDVIIRQESFGPITGLVAFDSLDEAIRMANEVDRTPLTLNAFGSKVETSKIISEVNSGTATINDSFMAGSLASIPFGGIGTSGTGSYRGKAGYEMWSHRRIVAAVPAWVEPLIRVRYMPYQTDELMRMQRLTQPTPDFDRNGKPIKGLAYRLGVLFGLGAQGTKGALLRWLMVLGLSWYALVLKGAQVAK